MTSSRTNRPTVPRLRRLAGGHLVFWATLGMACALASPAYAQRQRVPPEQQENTDARTARERDEGSRVAQPRQSAPAPEPAAAPAEPARQTSSPAGRRDRDDGGSTAVIRPTVIGPRPAIESVEIAPRTPIQPTVIGTPEDRDRDDHRDGRRDRPARNVYPTIIVVPPQFSSEAGWDVVDIAPSYPVEGTPAPSFEPVEYAAPAMPRPEPIPFMEWYSVNEQIKAGFPVPYPEHYANTYDRARFTNAVDGTDVTEPVSTSGTPIVPGAPLIPYAIGTFGGLTFDISPGEALVYVDGLFVGTAEDFAPDAAPLPLPANTHKVQLRMRGYRTEAFEVMVPLGQVMPLTGALVAERPAR